MSVIATDANRLSNVVHYEEGANFGLCRELVTFYDSAVTLTVGHVLGKTLTSGAGTATAGAGNTGNGTMGAITVAGTAKTGTYVLKINKVAANAGDFVVVGPDGYVVGTGTVGVAYSGGGLSFTLADGATDFALGDTFSIAVTGTEKWKVVEATATDGSQVAAGIFLSDAVGSFGSLTVSGSTNTSILILARGKAIVNEDALSYGASVNTADEIALAQAQLKALEIFVEETIA